MSQLTMPRRYVGPAPKGERRRTCDYCGIPWYQSVMRRDAAGLWACPDDQAGRDTVTLDRLNASGSPAAETVSVIDGGVRVVDGSDF